MFLMPEPFPSVCSLNTDSDFTSKEFNNDLRHTFSSIFNFSGDFGPLKLKAFQRDYLVCDKNTERIQTGFLNTPSSAIGWLNR